MKKEAEFSKENLKNYLKKIDDVIENGHYKDNWNSLKNHKVPDWYQNAKFGIFIHWGVYTVPSFGSEWYSRFMYLPDALRKEKNMYRHHIETYGAHKDFGYKDFVHMFKAENFDPDNWTDLIIKSGAKFVMPVAEHHDGFAMYDTELSDWCATKMGPKKDLIGMMKKSFEEKGLVFTASSHRIEHYWFMSGGREFESDMPGYDKEIPYGDLYWPSMPAEFKYNHQVEGLTVDPLFMEDWLARTCEIVDKYRPKIMYFDWWILIANLKPYLKKFAAYYYNRALEWGEEVTINYKDDAFMLGVGVRDIERGQLSEISPIFWQNDTSIAKNSWCYTEGNDYKKTHEVLQDLVDVVSKNGSLLLNIGPKADGTISDNDRKVLEEIGAWFDINGEAIHGTSFWKKFGEGPTKTLEGHHTDSLRSGYTSEDFRFTYKDNVLYVFAMNWPEDGVVRIKMLGRTQKMYGSLIQSLEVLGAPNGCSHVLCDDYLTVMAPDFKTKNPVCIKIIAD
ncbi:MAG: alpha-L-fucosidase [Clostridia bacterium]